MKSARLLIIGAMALGLALGIVIGPAFSATAASAQIVQSEHAGIGAPNSPLWNTFLDQLAAALNIQRSALDSAIVTAGNNTVDTAVQQGTLTQAQADAIKARIQAGDINALWGGGGRGPGKPAVGNLRQVMVDAAATTLGITPEELMTQLRGGTTLAAIAQAEGVTEASVTNAALAAAKAELNRVVSAGNLTQAQADSIYTQLEQQGAQLFTPRGHGGPGERGRGNHGAGPIPGQPAPTAVPSGTT